LEKRSVLVVGGGIAGIQAALDSADRGFKVYLVEKSPSIGGRMAQLDKTFPTMDCSICILAPKMIECYRHPNIELLTYSEVEKVSGSPGALRVTVRRKPRYVDEEKCTGCGECTKECPVKLPSEFDMGLRTREAIYRPFPQAIPNVFTIDKRGITPCRAACPAGVNIQAYVALTAQGKFEEALEVIRRNNPLPAVCGRVCFHPCEQECGRGEIDEPVAINPIKRFLADYERATKRKAERAPITREEKVAVVGAGPAGLTAAYQLVKKGYATTVFESLPEAGGMLRISLPRYRLPREALDADTRYITDTGVEIRTNTVVGRDITIEALLNDGYKAVFLAIGAGKSRKLHIGGEDLKGVVDALDLLTKASLGGGVELGKRVAVIGGGNVAVDAARVALRLGAEKVIILYRRSRKEMPASPEEVEEAEKEGVEIRFLASPKRVLGKAGNVSGLECVRMKLGPPDETGRRRPIPIEGSEHEVSVDTVVPAVGETPDVFFLPDDIKVTERGTVDVDPLTLQTSCPEVFAGGDVVSGPATVIEAIAAGNRAAVSIDRYLRAEDLRLGREDELELKPIDRSEVPKEGVERKKRQVMPCLPVERRLAGFDEVALGFTEEMAVEEAKRCLMCGGCCECLECEKLCEAEAIVHNQREELLEIDVGAIIVATGFVPFDPSQIKEYGYGRFKNVLTALEFERLVSASGPTGGKLLKPSDGKVAHKVAFIQCVGSRSQTKGMPYCSSACCMYATKEAILAREHDPNSEVYIFYIDLKVFGKGFQDFVDRAVKEWGVKYIRARPGEIREDPKTKDLAVWYEDIIARNVKSETVDLVVLCTGLLPRPENAELAETLGASLDQYGFFKSKDLMTAPLDSEARGVFLCGYCQGPKDIPESVAQASAAAARAAEIVVMQERRSKR